MTTADSSASSEQSVTTSVAPAPPPPATAPAATTPAAGNGVATPEPAAAPASVDVPPATQTSSGSFSLAADLPAIELVEGEPATAAVISLTPLDTDVDNISLSVESDSDDLDVSLSELDEGDGQATVSVSVQQAIGIAPIQPGVARITVAASDASGASATLTLSVNVIPTPRPDVYLLAGQSNMVGFSGPGSRLAGSGQPDAPMADVLQLNVTGNDQQNFAAPTSFTDDSRIAVNNPRYVPATDPLHDGFDTGIGGKSGSQIGLGLAFARSAREVTSAEIILVPAAWSDTGFCARNTNRFEGMGWNSARPDSNAFSGTLLHDRAIARTNLTLAETGGVLRGILWHQGEADSDNPICAAAYGANLAALAASLRTSIIADARGDAARGADAAVPFIVGTMSRGADSRGNFSVFSDSKQLVDDAHRSASALMPFADVVNNDDLVPPQYPCGEAACIHFGSTAYREMGNRYFEALQRVVTP